jgi:peptidoglycan/xylan/chitin deacetylase (PgdA/CDA1 family)
VKVVSLAEIASLPDTEDAVALTFDDALGGVGEFAAPLLADHGFPATVFVPTARVGSDNRWRDIGDPRIPLLPVLGWDEIGKLRETGWTVGAHTRSHVRLSRCDDAQIREELEGSADDIERALGKRPRCLAYPYGSTDDRVTLAAAQLFDIACTTDQRPLSPISTPLLLPRIDVYYFRSNNLLPKWGTLQQRAYIATRRTVSNIRYGFSDRISARPWLLNRTHGRA